MSMVDINPTMSTITLNVNSLNVPIKRLIFRVNEKPDPTICCMHEIHLKYTETFRLKVNGWRKIYHAKTDENAR
jgi:exonuclease III